MISVPIERCTKVPTRPACLSVCVCVCVCIHRGLRVKVGLDCGEVVGEVNALTGRCTYRGRPVTRSLRIMQMATSNQVHTHTHTCALRTTLSSLSAHACMVRKQQIHSCMKVHGVSAWQQVV